MDAGIIRLCGCTSQVQSMPVITDLMDQTILGCAHGFEPEWTWLRDICGDVIVPFGKCVADAITGTNAAMSEQEDQHSAPHVEFLLFSHSTVKEIVGLQVTGPYTYDVVWDPCPLQERMFHGRKNVVEWIAGQIVANRDNGDPGCSVISWG